MGKWLRDHKHYTQEHSKHKTALPLQVPKMFRVHSGTQLRVCDLQQDTCTHACKHTYIRAHTCNDTSLPGPVRGRFPSVCSAEGFMYIFFRAISHRSTVDSSNLMTRQAEEGPFHEGHFLYTKCKSPHAQGLEGNFPQTN